MAASRTSPSCSNVIPKRSGMARKTWGNSRRTRPRAASEKKGGRKPASEAQPGVVEAVEESVAERTAGSPVDPNIRWTNRSPREISEELAQQGYQVCRGPVRKILTQTLGLARPQAVKDEAGRESAFRDEQLRHHARRRPRQGRTRG